jgi:hypothetical protein
LAACLMLVASAAHADGRDGPWQFIEGTWRVDVSTRECNAAGQSTGNPLGMAFPTFNTYHRGGTLSEHGSRLPPAQRGSGHGIWRRTGYGTFEYRLSFQVFDPSGMFVATQNISAELTVSGGGNTLTGDSNFSRTDLSGNVSALQCATLAGTRMKF